MKRTGCRLLALLLCALLLTGCAANTPGGNEAQETILPTASAAGTEKTTGYGWYFDDLASTNNIGGFIK